MSAQRKQGILKGLSAFPSFEFQNRQNAGDRKVIVGHDGVVEIDEATRTVVKMYRDPRPEVAFKKAEREVDYAVRFVEAVSNMPGLSGTEVLEYDFSPPPRVLMQLCPGTPVLDFLRNVRADDPSVADIADKIHHCIEVYVETFPGIQHSFKLENMLYDDASGVLSLIDFAGDEELGDMHRDHPIDAQLGHLIGCTCYELARPSNLGLRKAAYVKLLRMVLTSFEGQLSNARIRDSASVCFLRAGRLGRTVRGVYYATFGTVLVERMLKDLGLSSATFAYDHDPKRS
ncbi:MAG TPA: hypothetical protein VFW94_09680 [Candidatus Acidoferrales bacterium]|nr:hypothetical protein [Candidatus Acidoferrales bacterium]